ncbi:SDR family NAD(P)-dependent oxidoreductase [Dactylosporangium sp. NPDC049742]|uniref:SDR family NAD(P)-dependent oxidoreductase n=1 Tax=Dactylosporangium sp. NPDC049742 TaxID=3154737 RepID=UPI003435DB00
MNGNLGAKTTAAEVIDGVDLSGRTAIVTGGASGIGTETTRALAAAGARVIVAVRDVAKAKGVVEAEVAELDLASIRSVDAFVATVSGPVHILVNNAGVMAAPFTLTADGFELQFGTNHLGHFALVQGLLPRLLEGAAQAGEARVVSVSSAGHHRSDVHLDDPNFQDRPYDRWQAYGQSKTANVLLAVELDRRHAGDGIVANALHPGGILTPLQRHLSVEEQVELGWIDEQGRPLQDFKTTGQGAATSVYAAVSPDLAKRGGQYLEDCAVATEYGGSGPFRGYMPYARDPKRAAELWERSEDWVGRARKG